jgi:RimJ/RimL family protein N-acetyltransferase
MRQEFVVIDYETEMGVVAILEENGKEIAVGLGHFIKDENTHTAEVAFTVREEYQGKGIATELLTYLTILAKNEGLHGFTAVVMLENRPMMRVFEKMGFEIHRTIEDNAYNLVMRFRDIHEKR